MSTRHYFTNQNVTCIHAFNVGERTLSCFKTPNGDFIVFGVTITCIASCFLLDEEGSGEFGDALLVFCFLFGDGVLAAEIACTDSRKFKAKASRSISLFDDSVLTGDNAGEVGTVRA